MILDNESKAELLAAFAACLEDDDPYPVTEPLPSLADLLAELAALRNEMKLQGRQNKQALDAVVATQQQLSDDKLRLQREVERLREAAEQAGRQAERPLLLAVLDLRDRLHAGARAAGKAQPSWLARRIAGNELRLIESLCQGQQMTLERIDDFLAGRNVKPVASLGQAADPQSMRVVATRADHHLAAGSVVEIVRQGFCWGAELLRSAEVIANKPEGTET